jgi:hypothetical protein
LPFSIFRIDTSIFLCTTTGQEVDLVLEKPGKKLVAVEIKAREFGDSQEVINTGRKVDQARKRKI